MKMKVIDHAILSALNENSIQAGRSQNLRPGRISGKPQGRYWINEHMVRERDGQQEVRMCVLLSLYSGQTVWLDVSSDEFATIPEIDVSDDEWETAMCAGTPPWSQAETLEWGRTRPG